MGASCRRPVRRSKLGGAAVVVQWSGPPARRAVGRPPGIPANGGVVMGGPAGGPDGWAGRGASADGT
jgi:hypothetical protein